MRQPADAGQHDGQLMLATSVLGPVLTELFAPHMLDAEEHSKL
jgi:hypothetical protein